MQAIVDELEVVQCEYVIAAYVRGRYEIEVYADVLDALDAIERHKEQCIRIDEIRLDVRARWGEHTASAYRRVDRNSKYNESGLKAELRLSIARYFAGLNIKKLAAH